ncbi:MAG: hypothetical protein COB09_10320 [Thalassobium sp.]|jgi:hypothetical protein|uniref:PepSY-associated TM helix domain-containing protein n=1 Tax=Thalassolituus pacificus TaxID=2975440 RepID=A0A9X2WDG5_9GAMM|nr:PepSY-associated TM helix domain-containing protein [Thalassolituus pacificus]MCT7358136.1 PepSY-associated TM helix domain-containing protein [Thalassolituus pacificus]PHS63631.1 MAG: hypothetical protein COB09_10320 [Thalassobium sp.]
MKTSTRRQLRFWLHKWHRRAGLLAALIVILVTLTGLLLNHIAATGLDRLYPQNSLILTPYQQALSRPLGVALGEHWLWSRDGQLQLDQQILTDCRQLQGYARGRDSQFVDCSSQWLLLDSNNQLLEVLEPSLFSEEPVTAVVWQGDAYQLQIGQDWFALDLLSYQLTAAAAPAASAEPLQVLPPQLASARNESISWQRVLLDLHSGRWFGTWGVWLVDVAALILLFLALSGAWIWFSRKRGF